MESPSPTTARMVGNNFVIRYYNTLLRSPRIAYRFYSDASRLIYADAHREEAAMTLDEIHGVVTSLDHEDCEILYVDSLDSFGGSVSILVTGAMHQNNRTRKFVQNFILAPKDRGFYIFSDIFRYLDEEAQSTTNSVDWGNYGMNEEYESSHMVSMAVAEANGSILLSDGGDSVITQESPLPMYGRDIEQRSNEEAVAYQINEAFTPSNPRSLEQLSLDQDTPSLPVEENLVERMSYAAILAQTAVSHEPIPYQPHSLSSHQHNASAKLPSEHSPAQARQDPLHVENEVQIRSVYVRNVPPNIGNKQLEDEMRKFGRVVPYSVSVRRNQEGPVYAFVHFEDSDSAQAAIEASPILIGGRNVHIEAKKSIYLGDPGRGRGRGQARGRSQNDGSKARGKGCK